MTKLTGLRGYLWGHRWNILLTTQAIFTCGIVYNRFQENQAAAKQQQGSRPQIRDQQNPEK